MAMFSDDVFYSSTGVRRTRALFKEVASTDDSPVFTLGKSDGTGEYISIRNLYIKFCVDDPSETNFSETIFGDVGLWLNISKCTWMAPHLEEWRMVCDTKRKAMAFEAVINEVKTSGKSAFSAAKFLIDEPWKVKRAPVRQRNKVKDEINKSTDAASEQVASHLSDLRKEGYFN